MLDGLLTDLNLNLTSLTAPPKAGPFAFESVAENQKSQRDSSYTRLGRDFPAEPRRRIAIRPFRVIRERPRAVSARNPRSRSRSTTAEGGRRFLKNAKSVKKLRSPLCKSRSTQERCRWAVSLATMECGGTNRHKFDTHTKSLNPDVVGIARTPKGLVTE